jgi:hypothetical protein
MRAGVWPLLGVPVGTLESPVGSPSLRLLRNVMRFWGALYGGYASGRDVNINETR